MITPDQIAADAAASMSDLIIGLMDKGAIEPLTAMLMHAQLGIVVKTSDDAGFQRGLLTVHTTLN